MRKIINKCLLILGAILLLQTLLWAKTVRSTKNYEDLLIESVTLEKRQLKVVTSIPDIADMCREIGGDLIKVNSIASGKEDLHVVPLKPSFVMKIRQSDMLFSLGLDAEHAWLPALVQSARSAKIYNGSRNWVEIYQGIKILGIPEKINKREGEQHLEGNPHYNLGINNGSIMSSNIYYFLSKKLPQQEKKLYQNWLNYKQKIVALEKELSAKKHFLKNKNIITYHADLDYLAKYYQMQIVATIEIKPGIPPTILHLKRIRELAKNKKIAYVICTQAQDKRLTQKVAKDIGSSFIEIAAGVGAKKEINTWLKLQRYNFEVFKQVKN